LEWSRVDNEESPADAGKGLSKTWLMPGKRNFKHVGGLYHN
jgi:hypothetical protein